MFELLLLLWLLLLLFIYECLLKCAHKVNAFCMYTITAKFLFYSLLFLTHTLATHINKFNYTIFRLIRSCSITTNNNMNKIIKLRYNLFVSFRLLKAFTHWCKNDGKKKTEFYALHFFRHMWYNFEQIFFQDKVKEARENGKDNFKNKQENTELNRIFCSFLFELFDGLFF